MPKFSVVLSSTANVEATVEVEAANRDAAGEAAVTMAKEGNVIWKYQGCNDEDIEVFSAQKVK